MLIHKYFDSMFKHCMMVFTTKKQAQQMNDFVIKRSYIRNREPDNQVGSHAYLSWSYIRNLLIFFVKCMLCCPCGIIIYCRSIYSKLFCQLSVPHILFSTKLMVFTFQGYYLRNLFSQSNKYFDFDISGI